MIIRRWMPVEGSGCGRVFILGTVVQLAECEKDNRQAALRALKKGPRYAAERERQRWDRRAYRNSH